MLSTVPYNIVCYKKHKVYLLPWVNCLSLSYIHSDIRGVAVAGVEGEPVNLTEPVTEAIAAAFAAWLLDKKKPDSSKRLRVSIGHDSRVSAQKLQVFAVNVLVNMNDIIFYLVIGVSSPIKWLVLIDSFDGCPVVGFIQDLMC